MRSFTAGTLLACTLHAANAATNTSLVQLLEQGRIQLTPTGLGGHSGECLKVDVRNLSASPIQTSIPPGWVFVSETPAIQDLVVVREEVIALAPHGRTTVTCRAFCCEASNGGPGENEAFRKGHPADEKLIALAQLVDTGRYDDDLVQSAVWVLSDGNDIASLGALDSTKADTLRNRLSALSGQPAPRYTMRYAQDGTRACSQRPETITRMISMDNSTPQSLTIVVKSDAGRTIEVLQDRMPMPAGGVDVPVTINVLGWPEGRYAFYVYTTEAAPVHRLPFTL